MAKKVKRKRKNPLMQKVARFFKEAVKIPDPDEEKKEPKATKPTKKEKPKVAKPPKVRRSELPDFSKITVKKPKKEIIESIDDGSREELLANLSEATSKWKETGDVGVKLKPPVSLKERVRKMWSKVSIGSGVSSRIKEQWARVLKRSEKKAKEQEQKGKPVNTSQIVRDEWKQVVERLDDTSSKEREEIEKIYKQLEAKEEHAN